MPAAIRVLLGMLLVMLLALAMVAAAAGQSAERYPPTIVFMTDFGVVDDSVALCRGVMYSIMPDVRIVDLTHQVTPFSIADGARFLFGTTPYFPAGTVFVVVIDPTVGSTRKAIIAKSQRGQYFVLPDNGLLTLVERRDGIAGRARNHQSGVDDWGEAFVDVPRARYFFPGGRACGAGRRLDAGRAGIPVKDLVRLDLKAAKFEGGSLVGQVIATDGPFGNLVTNVSAEDFLKLGYERGQEVPVKIGGKR